MHLFSSKVNAIGFLSVIIIVIFSLAVFYIIQILSESDVRQNLIEDQVQRQNTSTLALSQHIGSDLNLVMAVLEGLANSAYLQAGEVSAEKTKALVEQQYSTIQGIVDRVFVLDKNDIVTIGLSNSGKDRYLGADFSQRKWVQEAKETMKPAFSEGFERQGIYTIFIAVPIENRETGEPLGLIGASIPTESFFSHYGNVHDVNDQFLVAFDRNGTLLAVGVNRDLVGKDFFGPVVQDFVNHNPVLNNLTRHLLNGKAGSAIYDYGRGERINTASPITVQGQHSYFLEFVTPTNLILSKIGDALSTERFKSYSLLVGTLAAVAVLIVFLIKWSSTMEREVRKRTFELNESNRRLDSATRELRNSNISLQDANTQLKEQEKIQKEFINVAAHELRTPIQPILGLSGILSTNLKDSSQQEMIEIVMRNAKRLQRLSQDILDVSKIESHLMKLSKSQVDLTEKIKTVINDIKNAPANESKDGSVKIVFDSKEPIIVLADQDRLYQVVSNLIKNALKFTDNGEVVIKAERIKISPNNYSNSSEAIVTIRDTGSGIDPEIMPRLFTKFSTRSDSGTGLGLFISKAIVEAHGGRMWAQNNPDGPGATFWFTLPLADLTIVSQDTAKSQSV
jgi:signal transduction histidine kinase